MVRARAEAPRGRPIGREDSRDRRDGQSRHGPPVQGPRPVLPDVEQPDPEVLRELGRIQDPFVQSAASSLLLPDGRARRGYRADVSQLRLVRRLGWRANARLEGEGPRGGSFHAAIPRRGGENPGGGGGPRRRSPGFRYRIPRVVRPSHGGGPGARPGGEPGGQVLPYARGDRNACRGGSS